MRTVHASKKQGSPLSGPLEQLSAKDWNMTATFKVGKTFLVTFAR